MPKWLVIGLILLVLDIAAIGVFTGHTGRIIRKLPFNQAEIMDAVGGKGCSTCFMWLWAVFVLIMTVICLIVALTGGFRS